MVEVSSVDRFLPHDDPAPWAGITVTSSGSFSSLSWIEWYIARARSLVELSPMLTRSGRPTSPMNSESPVSTAFGLAPGCSRTTTLIDSHV